MAELWYALHVRPRFENYVQTNLVHKGYEAFSPTYVSRRRWSDRTKAITLPLFPSYVFCRFDVHSRLPILTTPGVNFVVGMGRSPISVDPQEITAVRNVLDSGVATRPWPYLKAGELVRIETGPLEGLTGIVVRTKGSQRLVISVSLLMRSVSVEIDRVNVKPLAAADLTEASDFRAVGETHPLSGTPVRPDTAHPS
jgi:transcriptional antiterminator NusG